MKKSMKIFALLFIITIFAFSAAAQNTKRAKDEAAIREIVKQMEAAWNAKDADSETPIYVEDVDYVNSHGTFLKGSAEIAEGHRQIFSTIYKDTTLKLKIEKIRFLDSEAGIVHVLTALKKLDKTTKGWLMIVVVKKDKKWKIAAQQITSIPE